MRASISLILSVVIGLAAGPAAAGASKPGMFRTLGLGVSGEALFYSLDGQDVPVTVTADARSGFFLCPPVESVEFYKKVARADGTEQRVPVARAVLAPGGSLPLLVFLPARKGEMELAVEVLDDSLSEFPAGSFRVLNRTEANMGIIIGPAKSEIPALMSKVLSGPGGGSTVFFQGYLLSPAGGRLIFSNNWAFNERLRTLVVIAPSASPTEPPSFRRIVEPAEVVNNARPASTPNAIPRS